MKFNTVRAVYFSATGTTQTVVRTIAQRLAAALCVPVQETDFTPPAARQAHYSFAEGDLVVFGTPVYAGRVPNLLLPFVQSGFAGNGAAAVPVAVFGNRNFDNALIELRDTLESNGFRTVAAAACVGEHAFSYTLGAGRPNADDKAQIEHFADDIAEALRALPALPPCPVNVAGDAPPWKYFQPQDRYGNKINILKVKPKTSDACTRCGLCARLCPLGAIDMQDPTQVPGKCMKCGACVKHCPKHVKYYDDAGYLYHQHELEEVYARPAENRFFI